MNILFFFVHPSKYHLFKYTINHLKSKGHHVDIAIITKDVLEELVKSEGWQYTNIFPEGRRHSNRPKMLSLALNAIKTVYQLHKYMKDKKYDLFITDDLLVIFGRLKRIPTFIYSDDDLEAVPEGAFFYRFTSHIISPAINNLGRYEKKKIAFNGYKELAYLHPDYFSPGESVPESFNPGKKPYFLLRFVSLTASHDSGKQGITNDFAFKIIQILERYGKIFITSERELPQSLENYRIQIEPNHIAHAVYFSEMFIGDSQTMTTEAAVLGVPAIRYNSFVGKISTMNELETNYGLTFGFKPGDEILMLNKIKELLKLENRRAIWQQRRNKMLNEKDDVNQFLIRLFENYNSHHRV